MRTILGGSECNFTLVVLDTSLGHGSADPYGAGDHSTPLHITCKKTALLRYRNIPESMLNQGAAQSMSSSPCYRISANWSRGVKDQPNIFYWQLPNKRLSVYNAPINTTWVWVQHSDNLYSCKCTMLSHEGTSRHYCFQWGETSFDNDQWVSLLTLSLWMNSTVNTVSELNYPSLPAKE